VKIHEKYIKRCIEIAQNGLGTTAPNPMVGCVITHKNRIISEGFTSVYGGNHAEVNAIKAVKDKSLLNEATLYVTLEPCSHFGKTPPCSDLIIKHNLPNVIIGCTDDNTKVAGKGITKLKSADCNVIVGVLENECKQHHNRFFTFHNKKRPFIILKWAETADGFIAPFRHYDTKNLEEVIPNSIKRLPQQTSLPRNDASPIWITNSFSRQLVHKWRSEEQAILVGTNTVIQDNPSLTTRHWKGKNPIRVVIDKTHKLIKEYNVFDASSKTIVISEDNINFNKPIAQQICNVLYKKNINSVIIEGGAQTLQTFINENLWDEARIFTGKAMFSKGTLAPKLKGRLILENALLDDTLKTFVND
jgi:diaminohydroxyphosphoribosylaminopyrimidine deaminase / 5-amino-6-(5-phosphoribosylamino)uracil reductase